MNHAVPISGEEQWRGGGGVAYEEIDINSILGSECDSTSHEGTTAGILRFGVSTMVHACRSHLIRGLCWGS